VWTASSAGTFLFSVALTAQKAWASGDQYNQATLTLALTPQSA
jgi:hypothetical protein